MLNILENVINYLEYFFPRLWEEYSWSRAVSLKPLTQLCLGSPKIVEPKSALIKLVNYLGEGKPNFFDA